MKERVWWQLLLRSWVGGVVVKAFGCRSPTLPCMQVCRCNMFIKPAKHCASFFTFRLHCQVHMPLLQLRNNIILA